MPNEIVKGIIGNALTSAAPDHIIAVTNDVFDEELQMYQSEINKSSGVYDISVAHASEGTPATYADLTAALGNGGENVPSNVRKPGMSVKFINSTTGQYEQYHLMSATWSTNVNNWQGVANDVKAGSKDLVTGAAVAKTHIEQFALVSYGQGTTNNYPVLNTNSNTFTIPAESKIVKQGRERIYTLDAPVVFNQGTSGGNYLIYDLVSGNTRVVEYDENIVLGVDEVIIAYVRWGQGVWEGKFQKYYLNDTLVNLIPDASVPVAIQNLQTQISSNAESIVRNKYISDAISRHLEGIANEAQGEFVQAGVIDGDGQFQSSANFSIYRYAVSVGQKLFICSKLVSIAKISNRATAYAYNDSTPVATILSPTSVRFDCITYEVPSGVDNICVYSSDEYGQYVGLIASDGEVDKIKKIVDSLTTQLSDLQDEIVTETTYDANDVYKDNENKTYYFTDLSGGVGTIIPSPSKASSLGATYYATIQNIEVKKGDIVIISSQTRGTTDKPRLWAFTDTNMKILAVAGWEEADKSTIANPLRYTVQQDGYCVVNVSPKTIDGFYVKVIHNRINILEDKVEDVEERTAELEEVVSNASFDDVETTSSTTGEYVKYADGTLTTGVASSRVHSVYSVNEGDVYSIKCTSIGDVGAVVAFFDSNGNYIKESSIQGKTNTVVRIIAVVPVGAATMHVSHVTTNIYIKKALGCPMNITGVNKAAASYVISNVTDVDAQSANPLEVLKETGGYTAIFHRIAVIGGSMATGAQDYDYNNNEYHRDNASKKENSVIQRMAAIYGGTAFNFSAGGMSARAWLDSSTVGGQSQDFINSGGTAGVDGKLGVQAYFIQVGNNDLNYHFTHPEYVLGTIADVNIGNESNNPDTYYGNLSKIVGRIRDVNPKAYVFFVTFVRGYNNQSYGYNPPADFDYNAAIREVYQAYRNASDAALFTEPYAIDELRFLLLDYYTYGKDWQYFRTGIHDKAYNRTHLSPMGYQYQAYEFCTYVDWLIKNDMKYFDDVQWIDVPGRRTRSDA